MTAMLLQHRLSFGRQCLAHNCATMHPAHAADEHELAGGGVDPAQRRTGPLRPGTTPTARWRRAGLGALGLPACQQGLWCLPVHSIILKVVVNFEQTHAFAITALSQGFAPLQVLRSGQLYVPSSAVPGRGAQPNDDSPLNNTFGWVWLSSVF